MKAGERTFSPNSFLYFFFLSLCFFSLFFLFPNAAKNLMSFYIKQQKTKNWN